MEREKMSTSTLVVYILIAVVALLLGMYLIGKLIPWN